MDVSQVLISVGVLLFLVISVVLILTILIQRPQGGGLSGAFGAGAGSGQTAFGTKTGDALTLATIGMFVAFVVVAILLNFGVRPPAAAPGGPTAGPAEGVVETEGGAAGDPAGANEPGVADAGAEGGDGAGAGTEAGTETGTETEAEAEAGTSDGVNGDGEPAAPATGEGGGL